VVKNSQSLSPSPKGLHGMAEAAEAASSTPQTECNPDQRKGAATVNAVVGKQQGELKLLSRAKLKQTEGLGRTSSNRNCRRNDCRERTRSSRNSEKIAEQARQAVPAMLMSVARVVKTMSPAEQIAYDEHLQVSLKKVQAENARKAVLAGEPGPINRNMS